MSAHQFKVGDKVVCIDASNSPGCAWMGGITEAPTEGATYTIEAIFVNDLGNIAFELVEIRRCASAIRQWGRTGYAARRFRPVQKRSTDISIFTALLNPTEDEKEIAELEEFILAHTDGIYP